MDWIRHMTTQNVPNNISKCAKHAENNPKIYLKSAKFLKMSKTFFFCQHH